MPTQHTTVKRHPERGVYDRATIDSILDEALICHLGFVADGRPFVIPTIHARDGDTLYVHGSPGSRMCSEPRRRAWTSASRSHSSTGSCLHARCTTTP